MRKYTFSIIGSGNVATHLTKGIQANGHTVREVVGRSFINSLQLANSLSCEAVRTVEELKPDSDIYLIAIKDDEIKNVAKKLKVKGIIAHTSGTISLDILSQSSENTGVFYPLQTFNKEKELDLKKIPFLIEASNAATETVLLQVATELSLHVNTANSANRKKVHLAAVFVNNFSNHIYRIAAELMEREGLSFDLLQPLVEETIHKIKLDHPARTQTGPAKRNDTEVIQEHLKMLDKHPDYAAIYSAISESIRKHNA